MYVQSFQSNKKRFQLFHATRMENVLGITKNDLKCKPPYKTIKNGSNYGQGIYCTTFSGYSAEFTNPRPDDKYTAMF